MPRASLSCALRGQWVKDKARARRLRPWAEPAKRKKDSCDVSQYLVLAGVTLFAAIGRHFPGSRMKQVGNVSLHGLPTLSSAF